MKSSLSEHMISAKSILDTSSAGVDPIIVS